MIGRQISPPVSNDHDTLMVWLTGVVILALATFAGVVVPLLIKTHREAREANDAVNHRHLRSDENGAPPKMYDAILAVQSRLGEVATHTEHLMERMDNNDWVHQNILERIERIERGSP